LLPQTTAHLGQAESEAAISKENERAPLERSSTLEERKLIMIGNYRPLF